MLLILESVVLASKAIVPAVIACLNYNTGPVASKLSKLV